MNWLDILLIIVIFIVAIGVPFSILWVILEIRENGIEKLFKTKINGKWY